MICDSAFRAIEIFKKHSWIVDSRNRMFSLFINLFDLVNDICLLIYDKGNGRIPNEAVMSKVNFVFIILAEDSLI